MNAVEPHLEKEWTGKMSEYGLPVHSPYETFYAQSLLLSGMTLESSLFIGGHILNPITYLKTINLEVQQLFSKCDLKIKSIRITWGFVRNANYWTLLEPY